MAKKEKQKEKQISIEEEVSNFTEIAGSMQADAEKFDKGVNAPASRMRKTLQFLRAECKRLRILIQEIKKLR